MSRGERGRPEPAGDPAADLAEFSRVLTRDPRHAARLALRVVRGARARGDGVLELRGYWALSSAASLRRRPRTVLAVIDRALLCPAARDDALLRARTLLGRGSALLHFGRTDDVRRDAEVALAVLRGRDARGEAAAHALLARAATACGRPEVAIRHLENERAALGGEATEFSLAVNEETEAGCRVARFEFAAGLRLFESAERRFAAVGAGFEAAHARFNAAYLHLRAGRFAAALRTYVEVEPVLASAHGVAAALAVDRAELLVEIGDLQAARHLALSTLSTSGSHVSARDARRAALLAAVAVLPDDPAAALRETTEICAACAAARDGIGQAEGLVVRCKAALAVGRSAEALAWADEAAALYALAGTPAAASAADLAGCAAALAAGDLDGAGTRVERAAARPGASALPWATVGIQRHRALVAGRRGRSAEAAATFESAIRDLEAWRAHVPPDAMRSAFFARHAPIYREAVRALLVDGRTERAFELAAASKSRSLLDLLADPDGAPLGLGDELAQVRADLGGAYSRIHQLSLTPGGVGELDAARAHADALERSAAEIVGRAVSRSPAACAPLAAPTAAAVRAGLGAGEVLVEYVADDAGLLGFVVTRDTVRSVPLGVAPAELARRVRRLSFHLGAAAARPDLEPAGACRANLAEIRRAVVDPLGLPPDAESVVIAADGPLHFVPFHALPGPGASDWWIDRALVSYTPSAFLRAAHAASRPAPGTRDVVLAIPDADAPAVLEEGKLVASVLGPSAALLVGDAASRGALEEALRSGRIVHLATHGIGRPASAVGASVRLADGWVTQFDLQGLRASASLVVLSACDSAVARIDASGDRFGLVRALLRAGVRTVVASRWRVDDRTAACWMGEFHRTLAGGAPVGAAYRAATSATLRTRPHPYHWAPFVLVGAAGNP